MPPSYNVTERGSHQIFLPLTDTNHPFDPKYNQPMPAPEIMDWLAERGYNYWAMGWPYFHGDRYQVGTFMGSGFNFKDRDTAMLFKLTWVGV